MSSVVFDVMVCCNVMIFVFDDEFLSFDSLSYVSNGLLFLCRLVLNLVCVLLLLCSCCVVSCSCFVSCVCVSLCGDGVISRLMMIVMLIGIVIIS